MCSLGRVVSQIGDFLPIAQTTDSFSTVPSKKPPIRLLASFCRPTKLSFLKIYTSNGQSGTNYPSFLILPWISPHSLFFLGLRPFMYYIHHWMSAWHESHIATYNTIKTTQFEAEEKVRFFIRKLFTLSFTCKLSSLFRNCQ